MSSPPDCIRGGSFDPCFGVYTAYVGGGPCRLAMYGCDPVVLAPDPELAFPPIAREMRLPTISEVFELTARAFPLTE